MNLSKEKLSVKNSLVLKKLNLGVSTAILSAILLGCNALQVKADNLGETNANVQEQSSVVKSESDTTQTGNESSVPKVSSDDNSVTMNQKNNVELKSSQSSITNNNTSSQSKIDGTLTNNDEKKEFVESKQKAENNDSTVEFRISNSNENSRKHQSLSIALYSVPNYKRNAWVYDSDNNKWSYAKDDGTRAEEQWIVATDGQWYYFDANGIMAANGWSDTRLANGDWKEYYFDGNGHYLTNHWNYNPDNNEWSYAKDDGTRAEEQWIVATDGQWYYFDANGIMAANGWSDTRLANGDWKEYYFDDNGHYVMSK